MAWAGCWWHSLQAYTILIDPGHGGDDEGATVRDYRSGKKGKGRIREKYLTLQLAQRIHRQLAKKHSVFLTRSGDRSLSLNQRAEMAEKVKADVLISVHFNSSSQRAPHGFETYYLDNSQNRAAHKLAGVENQHLSGKELEINNILIDLAVKKTVETGKVLARHIHTQIARTVGRRYRLNNRGIRPALFHVLALSKRPVVLLEPGFLSNPKEQARLLDAKFQESYAAAVAQGVEAYLAQRPPFVARQSPQ